MTKRTWIVAGLASCITVASACSGENGSPHGSTEPECAGQVAGSRFSVCGGSIGPRTEGEGARFSAAARTGAFGTAAGASHTVTAAEVLP